MNLRNTARAALAMTLVGSFFGSFPSSAETLLRQPDAMRLLQSVERLSVVGNVLYVAAHPDDENTQLLSYLHGEKMLRAAYLSVTRGDGGQNLIGPEQGPLLGLIRTQELLAARRVDGAEQFFTRARDFGYSKTTDETLAIWGKDAVLADMVLVIRKFKPDVIITRFSTQGGTTHGHHTASAMLAKEAFSAAADPSFHPEQLKLAGVSTWQAKRIAWNRYAWGRRPTEDMSALPKLDIGGYNPLLGLSYGEISADSHSMHKSQGFGSARERGPQLEHFQPLIADGKPAPTGIFEGLDFTWGRLPAAAKLAQLLKQAQKEFDPHHPEAMLATLIAARGELTRLPENPWKAHKLAELDEVIVMSAGLYAEVSAREYAVAQGGALMLDLSVVNRSTVTLRLKDIRLPGSELHPDRLLSTNQPLAIEHSIKIPENIPVSNPYWLAEAPEKGMYVVRDPQRIGLPENPAPLFAEFVFALGASGDQLVIRRPVLHKWTDPVAGERHRSIEITPEVMVNAESAVLMFPDAQPRPLRVRLTAGAASKGTVRLELPAGFTAEPSALPFTLEKKGAEQELRFTLRPPTGTPAQPQFGNLQIIAEVAGGAASKDAPKMARGMLHIDYPHIPIQSLFPPAEVKLCRFDLKKTRSKIGYIAGAGDDVPAALRQAGYEVTLLNDEALGEKPAAALKQYAAIVVGVRAYNTNPRLALYYQRLMDYVSGGGNLIVQYNTNNRISKVNGLIGPYSFDISQERVTDENAAVAFELPSHPLLAKPNRISDSDFVGWVQERGLYFADKWNEKYETPLSMHDAGEPPRKGGVLVARHGKGAFIYTGLAFFRQLPAGVPGAYRLFANMISYGQ